MRARKGSWTVEAFASLLVIIPVCLLLFNVIVVFVGHQTNQTFSRDAARAASLVRPDASGPQAATAQTWIKANQICTDGRTNMVRGYFSGPDLAGVEVRNYTPAGPFGGSYSGTVHVTTNLRVNIPASIPNVIPETILLQSTSSFPLTGSSESVIVPN
jgi:hypothetical protein